MSCGAIFCVNTNIIMSWVCSMFEIICFGTSSWYILHHDKYLEYRHGGLWFECMGRTDRTLCTLFLEIPSWLAATRALFVITGLFTLVILIYLTISMMKKNLSFRVVNYLNTMKGIVFLFPLVLYSLKAFGVNKTPGSSFIGAWLTFSFHLLTSTLWIYSRKLVRRLPIIEFIDSGFGI